MENKAHTFNVFKFIRTIRTPTWSTFLGSIHPGKSSTQADHRSQHWLSRLHLERRQTDSGATKRSHCIILICLRLDDFPFLFLFIWKALVSSHPSLSLSLSCTYKYLGRCWMYLTRDAFIFIYHRIIVWCTQIRTNGRFYFLITLEWFKKLISIVPLQ